MENNPHNVFSPSRMGSQFYGELPPSRGYEMTRIRVNIEQVEMDTTQLFYVFTTPPIDQ